MVLFRWIISLCGLDMNDLLYRWMAGNSETVVWSTASEDSMLVFWDLNDNTNAFIDVEVVKQLM